MNEIKIIKKRRKRAEKKYNKAYKESIVNPYKYKSMEMAFAKLEMILCDKAIERLENEKNI